MSGGYHDDLSFREREVCEARDRGVPEAKLAERFDVTPERIRQIESQSRLKLAGLPLTEARFETLIDSVIRRARSSDAPDLSIRAAVLSPYRELGCLPPASTSAKEEH